MSLALIIPLVRQQDLDLLRLLDHMVVRDDVPVLGHDDPGPQALLLVFLRHIWVRELVAEEPPEKGVVEKVEGRFIP